MLHLAARYNDEDLVEELIKHHENIMATSTKVIFMDVNRGNT